MISAFMDFCLPKTQQNLHRRMRRRYFAQSDMASYMAVCFSREQKVNTKRQIVFVSCGQFSDEEKSLGNRVADLVTEITPFQGYFAQNQSSLEGVAEHILGAINRCVGFIAIMHHRGQVAGINSNSIRASVWIEQEIAVAAFLKLIQRRPLDVLVFSRSGIALEGLREKLMLNPVIFDDDNDLMERLRAVLPFWKSNLAASGFGESSLEGKIRASLGHCQGTNVTVNVANDSDFEIILKRIEMQGESGLITEPHERAEGVPIRPRHPTNPFHWVAQTPPAATLCQWSSIRGLFFDADIQIVLEFEVFGGLRRTSEKKRVRVSASNFQLVQLGP
jgi:hypothetical protein